MSIAIKVPALPYAAAEARVGHWYRSVNEVVARGEMLVELLVQGEIIAILAPQPGILKQIFFTENQTAPVGAILALIETGLPNLVWDAQQETLILDNYRAGGVTSSMEYELRIMLREKVGKLANGFGSALALPQANASQQEHGLQHGAMEQRRFEQNPLLKDSSQFAGDPKGRANTVPANREAQVEPQNAPSLSAKLNLTPSAPTPKPSR